MPSSYENWMSEIQRRAEARQKEEQTYDTARQGEQGALEQHQQYAAGAPGRQEAYEQNWQANERLRRAKYRKKYGLKPLTALLPGEEKRKRLFRTAPPARIPPTPGKPGTTGIDDPRRPVPNKPWLRGRPDPVPVGKRPKFQPGKMTPYYEAPQGAAPGVRTQRATYDPRTTGPISGAGRGIDRTAQYGGDFLESYGRDVLGMNPQMTPLQRLMNFNDKSYGEGELQYGSQAARDYYARSLGDYFKQQQPSGDYSAFEENRSLQQGAQKRLGLSYGGYGDLQEQLKNQYGYAQR